MYTSNQACPYMAFKFGSTAKTLAGTTLYLVLQSAGVGREVAALLGMLSVAALRIAAVLWGLRLPDFHLRDGGGSQ